MSPRPTSSLSAGNSMVTWSELTRPSCWAGANPVPDMPTSRHRADTNRRPDLNMVSIRRPSGAGRHPAGAAEKRDYVKLASAVSSSS